MIRRAKSASFRKFAPRVAVLAVLGMICAAYGATAWFAHAEDKTAAKAADAKAKKATHPPIDAMRKRMLAQFHGETIGTFTSIPGFGMERMEPLYKLVPFEIPDLSTNEVEVREEPVPPAVLKDIFTLSLEKFRDPAKPPSHKPPAGMGQSTGFGRPGHHPVFGGLQLRMLDLVGLINADGPKVYSGGQAFEVQRMTAAEVKAVRQGTSNVARFAPPGGPQNKVPQLATGLALADAGKRPTRPLDIFETTGVAELRDGKELFIRTRGNVIRMLGALRASGQCLECHGDSKRGDLLGAFSYTFVDSPNALAGQMHNKSAK